MGDKDKRSPVGPFLAVIAFRIFSSRAVSSTRNGESRAKSFSAFFIVSADRSRWFVSIVLAFTICLRRMRLTVSCFLNFFRGLTGHFCCFIWLTRLSTSDRLLLSHDSWLFCWYSFSGVVPRVSQWKNSGRIYCKSACLIPWFSFSLVVMDDSLVVTRCPCFFRQPRFFQGSRLFFSLSIIYEFQESAPFSCE